MHPPTCTHTHSLARPPTHSLTHPPTHTHPLTPPSRKLRWYALCPVIDLANHSSGAESQVAFEYFKDSFVLTTAAAHAPGEQVRARWCVVWVHVC